MRDDSEGSEGRFRSQGLRNETPQGLRAMDNKVIHIIGGGTVSYLASHLATCAPAFGWTARRLAEMCSLTFGKMDVKLHLTQMAGGSKDLMTNDDMSRLVDQLIASDTTKIIFMT